MIRFVRSRKNTKMYDNIKLNIAYQFKTKKELDDFCEKHNLSSDWKGIYSNGNKKNLQQNKGIYIKVYQPTKTQKGKITIVFSLQKFYNEIKGESRQNWNDFNFKQANEAKRLLDDFLKLETDTAKVMFYEIGINVKTAKPQKKYLEQLDCISIKGRELKILEDVTRKEYTQYSTNRSKEKRIVYVFYNKTYEAQSKYTSDKDKNSVPKNILRIEMKYKRSIENIKFARLFDTDFQKSLFEEFAEKITEKLRYKTKQVNPPKLTNKQFELYKRQKATSPSRTRAELKKKCECNELTKRQYYYLLELLKGLEGITGEIETISQEAEELKTLIQSKLDFYKNCNF